MNYSGIATGVGYICLNRGLSIERSGTASLIRNLETVLAYIIQVQEREKYQNREEIYHILDVVQIFAIFGPENL